MENLEFRFPDEEFGDIPTMDFLGYQHQNEKTLESPETKREIYYREEKRIQEPKENLEFTMNENKENTFPKNIVKTQTLQNIKSNLNYANPQNKHLKALPKKNKKTSKSKNKFKKPFQKQKRTNTSKIIKKEWNDNTKIEGVFEKVGSIGFKEHQIKERNKEKSENKQDLLKKTDQVQRLKYKTYETPQELQESVSREADQKRQFVKQVKARKEKIKEIENLIDNEQQKKNVIYEKFSTNLKTFQSQKVFQAKSLPKKSTSNSRPKYSPNPFSDNLLEIENYTPPKRSFPAKSEQFLNHEHFEQQLNLKKQAIKKQIENDIDEIPTKENGDTQHTVSAKKAKALLGVQNYRSVKVSSGNNDLVSNIENQEKERILDDMIQKHKDEVMKSKGIFKPTELTKQINKNIAQIKHEMEPFLNNLSKRSKEIANYPFTHNLLSNACSKLVCVNSEQITEMIVDDIMIELVEILNENEQEEIKDEKSEKKNGLIEDFVEALKDLQCDQDEILNKRNEFVPIENRIREIRVEDLIKNEKKACYRILEFSEKTADKILRDKLELDSLINGKSLNDKKMVNRMRDASEILISQVFNEVFEEFDRAQDEFVERLYEQEFFQK